MTKKDTDDAEVKHLNIGDVVDTPYGKFEVIDIERHHFDPPFAHIDLVEVADEG